MNTLVAEPICNTKEEKVTILLSNALNLLIDIWISELVIKKFVMYSEVLKKMEVEFKYIWEKETSSFRHDLNNTIGAIISFSEIISISENEAEINRFKSIINSVVNDSLRSFIERRVNYLKEKWRKNRVIEIGDLMWVDFLDMKEQNSLEYFKNTIWKLTGLIDFDYTEKEWVLSFTKNEEKIIIDLSNSKLDTFVSQEFWIIIENLIWNSLKSYKKSKREKNKDVFKIICTLKEIDWQISFQVKDNGGWIDRKAIVQEISKKLQDTKTVVKWVKDNVLKILKEGFFNPDIIEELTISDIRKLVFSYWVSTFWTSWIWLYLCKKQLDDNWWSIEVKEDLSWNVSFTGIYKNKNTLEPIKN